MLVNLITKLYQDCKFSVTKFLLKETFNGLELKMSAIVALFFQIILYRLGVALLRMWRPAMYPTRI
jgi:hypothetical protein